MKNEFQFIEQLRVKSAEKVADLSLGIGDDAAIILPRSDQELLISTDLLIEEIHFSLSFTAPELLGYKALAVNLSDMAAMGAKPRFYLLSIARPKHITDEILDRLMQGMSNIAAQYNVALIGGDTTSSKHNLMLNITILGETAQGKAIKRSTAQIGDLICVTGSLGGSARGLELLLAGERLQHTNHQLINGISSKIDADAAQLCIKSHLMPIPRVEIGLYLSASSLATSMMDISDGISSDLGHICDESKVGAEVYLHRLPIAFDATIDQALNGGEDYELLFTINPQKSDALLALRHRFPEVTITEVGHITADLTRWLIKDQQREILLPKGFDHFSSGG